ncbi:glycosyltransferase [Conexibacter sp. W3-3-2]|uniref:Glycosyl transferase family 1 domain-containing protein n=1 Tax=Paraconexibacter algicola TaxID=2133960 RepID=A0A2T4UCA4_9ACTN|nr:MULTISPECIES: glycosyltransferase family 4 protein [Solirubrobacterales]MTD43085.1 glycosyltransferase [Conexibacter sp. W3-3-2]PTL54844.1 hypothetical protein C7Y72_19870 [Paraconexibacter algicola]
MPSLVSILPSDLARARGGAERYAVELHAALRAELPGWEHRALVAVSAGAAEHLPDGWSAVQGRLAGRVSAGDAIGPLDVARVLARRPTVVLSHQWRTRSATTLRAACRLLRGTTLVSMDHGAGTRLGYVLSWTPLPGADVGAHQSVFEQRISPIGARRHCVVRGGIDDARFAPAEDVEPDIDFLMVGRFVPYKGQLRFLEQLPAGARAVLVGPSDSVDPDYLAAVAAAAREAGVEVRYDVSDAELVATYRRARHTVQVPIDVRRYGSGAGAAPPELLGLTMLEAMACGSVPICPADGASAEFVTDGVTGRTYDAQDDRALAAVLARALADREGTATLRAGAIAESARWTWRAAARELIAAVPALGGR